MIVEPAGRQRREVILSSHSAPPLRRTAAILVAAAIASAVRPPRALAADPPRKVTLAELTELARQRGRLVAAAEAGVEVRQAQRREALFNWFPAGAATYAITGAPSIQCRGPGNDANPLTRTRDCVNTVDPSTGSNISATSTGIGGVGMQGTLTLLQPLYTFGKIEAGVSAAEHGIAAGRALADTARAETAVDAARAYWGLKVARTALLALEAVREEVMPWVEKIQRSLDSDRPSYTISDLQRLKAALNEIDVLRGQLRQASTVATAGLFALAGEPLDVDDEELDAASDSVAPLAELEAALLSRRPEVRALDEGGAALRQLARLKRNEMLPDVGIIVSVLLRYTSSIEDADSAFIDHATTARFSAALGVQQPLDLFERWARWQRAKTEAAELGAKREAAATGLLLDLRAAYAAVEEAKGRLQSTAGGEKTSRGWLTAVKSSLDFGTAEPRDLSDAARNYIEWRLRHFQAIADYNLALARLRRASGL